jgi:hypothetical protein
MQSTPHPQLPTPNSCRVRADHAVPERAPHRFEVGDPVSVGTRDTEWPAFVFVTAERGSGWVPARHIDTTSSPPTMRATYDTQELPASEGETVQLVLDDPESGWAWCRDADGREGWLPHRALTLD